MLGDINARHLISFSQQCFGIYPRPRANISCAPSLPFLNQLSKYATAYFIHPVIKAFTKRQIPHALFAPVRREPLIPKLLCVHALSYSILPSVMKARSRSARTFQSNCFTLSRALSATFLASAGLLATCLIPAASASGLSGSTSHAPPSPTSSRTLGKS